MSAVSLAGKRVLLVITGGIAAYKCWELIRRLRDGGAAVRVVMTAGAAQFVTPLSVQALSEDKVYSALFSLTDESEMGHIRLSREADLVVVAPASADFIAKMATGAADDLASTVLLASDKPVMMAPAMNAQMWAHPAVAANVAPARARRAANRPRGGGARLRRGRRRPHGRTGDHPGGHRRALGRDRRADRSTRPGHQRPDLRTDPVRYIANRSPANRGTPSPPPCAISGRRSPW